MLTFLKKFFTSKAQEPTPGAPYKVEAPSAKVEAVNAQPVVTNSKSSDNVPVAKVAKKRSIVKREEGGTAKVAKIKGPATKKPKAKKETE